MKIIINDIPISINNYIGRNIIWKYQQDKKYFINYAIITTLDYKPKKPIEKCNITITYHYKNNRRNDLDNNIKFIMDFLVQGEFIIDDNYKIVNLLTLKGIYDKKGITEIEIEELTK